MIGGAFLVPIGTLIMLALNPYDKSFTESLSTVIERVLARPLSIAAFVFWMLVFAGLGGLLGHLVHRRKRQERLEATQCVGCGYDLTGTVIANRAKCPECGLPIDRRRITSA